MVKLRMTKYNVGDTVLITVGDREFTTVIDEHDVQRFKVNSVINAYNDTVSAEWDKWMYSDRSMPEPFGLNMLAVEYAHGKHSLDDMLTFYTSIGYSVAGFSDLSYFEELDIRNPIWEQNDYRKLSSKAFAELMELIEEPYEHSGNEAVRYVFDVVRDGKWTTDNAGNYIAASDTIDRVVYSFLGTKDIEPWDILVKDETSQELKDFLKHLSS